MNNLLIIFLGLITLSCKTASIPSGKFSNSAENSAVVIDTIHIGPNRPIKSLNDYFATEEVKRNVHVIVDEGTYYSEELWVHGENLTIEGQDTVNVYCTKLNQNVMWVSGSDIVIRNLRMKHFLPGTIDYQNCTGRVIAFDNADRVTIEDCDLNGCGLAGLHDNLENSDIFVKNNYIHNNSLGAYTDIEGNVWLEEINDHPVFRFENNRIENNGETRILEFDGIDDYIVACPETIKPELRAFLQTKIDQWKAIPNPFEARFTGYLFENDNGGFYDLKFGEEDYEITMMLEEYDGYELRHFNKLFKVYWEWAPTTFTCCSTELSYVEGYLPSIVKAVPLDSTVDEE